MRYPLVRILFVAYALACTATHAQGELVQLVIQGTPDQLRAALEAGADANEGSDEGRSLLIAAFLRSEHQLEVIDMLLHAGADPNTRGGPANHPALVLAMQLLPDAVPLLLAAGADVEARAGGGLTALHRATQFPERAELVRWLLDAGANPNARDENGLTPLVHAIYETYGSTNEEAFAVVRTLLDAGADVNARANLGVTPLAIVAGGSTSPPLVHLLLAAGADLEARDDLGHTPLLLASRYNPDPIMVSTLSAAGADLAAVTTEGATALGLAIANNERAVRALLEAGADPHHRTEDGTSLAFTAALFGSAETMRALLEAGLDATETLSDGGTLLHAASRYNTDPEVLDVLLAAGGDPRATTPDGKRAIDNARDNPALYDTPSYWRLNDASY